MYLDNLSKSCKCSESIGNSLNIYDMMSEVIKTFVSETDAFCGSFYVQRKDNIYEDIVSVGKSILLNLDSLVSTFEDKEIIINDYNEKIKISLYKLDRGYIFLAYEINHDFDFITSTFKNLKNKLNTSINSCLIIENLKEDKKLLSEENMQLKEFLNNSRNEITNSKKQNNKKEQQIIEQLKMVQMGELIGNIAHQWREPLSVISTAASGMQVKKEMQILTDPDFEQYTQSIIENSSYLSNTIDEFRDYIDDSHKQKEVIIQERLQTAINLVESSFSLQNIKIKEGFLEKEDIQFKLILGELSQVLISILNNSKDAFIINDIKDRWVKYELYKKDFGVLITIEDSAGGIPINIIDKIFNPYFTTKQEYQGTGIGLYSGYDIIVNKLKGKLSVENTEHGAKFFIELPLPITKVNKF